MQKSLIESNRERAVLIASACASRLDAMGRQTAWQGYGSGESLEGRLETDTLLRYVRQDGQNFALLFFDGPRITEPEKVDWGEEKTLQKDVVERFKEPIEKVKGVAYDDTISHTFSKTTSLQEGFKVGAEEAIKTTFEASYSGVKGGAELSAKLTEEYHREWGETTTTTDTTERHIQIPADYEGSLIYEAVRSVDKVQRKITAKSNMDYYISFVSGPSIPPANHPLVELNWESLDEFLQVAQGLAAATHAGYDLFIDNPLTDAEIDAIKKAGVQSIEILADYDNVQTQEIKIVDA